MLNTIEETEAILLEDIEINCDNENCYGIAKWVYLHDECIAVLCQKCKTKSIEWIITHPKLFFYCIVCRHVECGSEWLRILCWEKI